MAPVIVVGGGPAGLVAALTASQDNVPVVLFNKNPWPGKKVAAIPPDEFIFTEKLPPTRMAAKFGEKAPFVEPFLKNFSYQDMVRLLKRFGFELKPDESGHFHSNGYRAEAVFGTLTEKAVESGVRIVKSARVTDILIEQGCVKGVVVNGSIHKASAVILATGSFSSPKFGSTLDGYRIAQNSGHTVNRIKPAMVDILVKEKEYRLLAGETLDGIILTILCEGEPIFSGKGRIKFTNHGISGPLILDHSSQIVELLNGHKVELAIDLIPDLSKEQLETMLLKAKSEKTRMNVSEYLATHVEPKIAGAIAKLTNQNLNKSLVRLTNLERKALIVELKDWRLTVRGSRPFNYTRGVKGGVAIENIDPESGQSRLVKNLFFAGAVMDVLGPWGGFNMQFAFSSGYVAGKQAAAAFRAENN